MLELDFHDCIRAAAGVRRPAPGGGQCLLCRSRVRAGQCARDPHPAVNRSSPRGRPHRSQTSPATQPRRQRRATGNHHYQPVPGLAGRAGSGPIVRGLDRKRAACLDLCSCHRRSGSLRDDHQPSRNPRRTGSEVARLATGRARCPGGRRAHGRFSHRHLPPDHGHEPRRWFCSAHFRHPRNPPRLSALSRRTQAHRDRCPPLRATLSRPGRDAAECPRTRQHRGASSDGAANQNFFLALRPQPGRGPGASGRRSTLAHPRL